MDISIPASALAPFAVEQITLYCSDARHSLGKPYVVRAQVLVSDPYAIDNGIGDSAQPTTYSVSIPASEIPGIDVKEGSIVQYGTRPRMIVTQAVKLQSMWHLTCTTQERG